MCGNSRGCIVRSSLDILNFNWQSQISNFSFTIQQPSRITWDSRIIISALYGILFVSVLKLVESRKANLIACTRIDQYAGDFFSFFIEKNSGVYVWPVPRVESIRKSNCKTREINKLIKTKGAHKHTYTHITHVCVCVCETLNWGCCRHTESVSLKIERWYTDSPLYVIQT